MYGAFAPLPPRLRGGQTAGRPRQRPLGAFLPAVALRIGILWATVRRWREKARQRAELACLSDHMLRDIGIRREDALREAGKPFWR